MSMEWMENARCKNMGSELFMSESKKDIKEAIAICLGCPAIKACLEYAIANKEQGVWGGTTERQRLRLIKYKDQKISVKLRQNIQID